MGKLRWRGSAAARTAAAAGRRIRRTTANRSKRRRTCLAIDASARSQHSAYWRGAATAAINSSPIANGSKCAGCVVFVIADVTGISVVNRSSCSPARLARLTQETLILARGLLTSQWSVGCAHACLSCGRLSRSNVHERCSCRRRSRPAAKLMSSRRFNHSESRAHPVGCWLSPGFLASPRARQSLAH